jgi:hypothetical protein
MDDLFNLSNYTKAWSRTVWDEEKWTCHNIGISQVQLTPLSGLYLPP